MSELSEFSFFAKSFILQVYDVLARHNLFQSGFVSRCDFLTGQAEDLRISQPCSRARRG
jgi:hypothetical protein